MENIHNIITKMVKFLFIFFFGIALVAAFGAAMYLNFLAIISTVVFVFIGYKAYKKLSGENYKITNRQFCIFLILSIVFMTIIQLIFAYFLKVEPCFDRLVIIQQCRDMLEKGELKTCHDYNYYFLKYPNNRFICIFESGYFFFLKGLGIQFDTVFALSILNIICINIAIVITICLVRKIKGNNQAFGFMILCILFPVFYLFVPFFYTDTLAMPFVAGAIYLFYSLLQNIEQRKIKKSILLSIILSIVLTIGFLIKATVILLVIAFAVFIFTTDLKKRLCFLCIGVITLSAGMQIFTVNKTIEYNQVFDETNYDAINFPYIHWLMMGLQEYGNFKKSDRIFTDLFKTKEEKKQANIKVIKERIKNYGVVGMFVHVAKKIGYTWYSGMYDMDYYLRRGSLHNNLLSNSIYVNGKHPKIAKFYCNGLHILIVLGLFCVSFIKNKKKDFDFFLKIALVGLLCFLLFWETRPRYLVHYMPVILMISHSGLTIIFKKIEKFIYKKKDDKLKENDAPIMVTNN